MVACKECPLSTPAYNFTFEETNPCVSYALTVFAFNAAGQGDPRFYRCHGDVQG